MLIKSQSTKVTGAGREKRKLLTQQALWGLREIKVRYRDVSFVPEIRGKSFIVISRDASIKKRWLKVIYRE